MAKEVRRFPPPWSIIEHDESFAVVDATGFNLAYLYFAEGQRGFHMARLTRDEARRIANAIARLPELLAKPKA
jgi:hypothetical protein